MVLEDIFSTNIISKARVISRDSKIYEAFKPYLLEILGISLEDYMKNKDLRRNYRQKYAIIKAKFQEQSQRRFPMKDYECLTKIAEYSEEWHEFVTTAKENTLDGGKSFISSTPLDKYVLMTPQEKVVLENRLVSAAVKRVRSYAADFQPSNTVELNKMLNDNSDTLSGQVSHKI